MTTTWTQDAETIDYARGWLTSEILEPARKAIAAQAHELARGTGIDEHEARVWLARLLAEGAAVMVDAQAGEAEAAGRPIGDIGRVVGQSTTSNTRRKLPHMRAFARARDAAELTGVPVKVTAAGWTLTLTPTTTG